VLVTVGFAAPAEAGPIYQPRCYDTLCLVRDVVPGTPSYNVLAWSRYDVGPTPYYISVFDTYTGELLALCGSGTSCLSPFFGEQTVEVNGCVHLIAYIGGFPETMPPAPVLQTSAIFTWCLPGG